mgnify:CR=1 FL=1
MRLKIFAVALVAAAAAVVFLRCCVALGATTAAASTTTAAGLAKIATLGWAFATETLERAYKSFTRTFLIAPIVTFTVALIVWAVVPFAPGGNADLTGRLFADAYSVSPCAIFVPEESPIRHPKDLADVPISVGYQSGSHYSTIQALEAYLPREAIRLSFADGIRTEPGDVFEIEMKEFGAALRNTLAKKSAEDFAYGGVAVL